MTTILADPGVVVGLIIAAFIAGAIVGAKIMESIDRPRAWSPPWRRLDLRPKGNRRRRRKGPTP